MLISIRKIIKCNTSWNQILALFCGQFPLRSCFLHRTVRWMGKVEIWIIHCVISTSSRFPPLFGRTCRKTQWRTEQRKRQQHNNAESLFFPHLTGSFFLSAYNANEPPRTMFRRRNKMGILNSVFFLLFVCSFSTTTSSLINCVYLNCVEKSYYALCWGWFAFSFLLPCAVCWRFVALSSRKMGPLSIFGGRISYLHIQGSFARRVVCLSTFDVSILIFGWCRRLREFFTSSFLSADDKHYTKALAVYRSRKNVICDVFMSRVTSWALAGERAEYTTRITNELAMMFYIIRGKILIAFHFMPRIFDFLRFIYHSTRHCRTDELCFLFFAPCRLAQSRRQATQGTWQWAKYARSFIGSFN